MRKLFAVATTLLIAVSLVACTKKAPLPQPEPTVLTAPEVKAVETALGSADQEARDTALVPELRGSNF
ncbi:MAG TPA: hypothetical protein VFT87_02385, partial [Candidatus Saccharimonadales bacterium]|nr:hypothetical protein [Candidatus Saccharimonadales bacterium]